MHFVPKCLEIFLFVFCFSHLLLVNTEKTVALVCPMSAINLQGKENQEDILTHLFPLQVPCCPIPSSLTPTQRPCLLQVLFSSILLCPLPWLPCTQRPCLLQVLSSILLLCRPFPPPTPLETGRVRHTALYPLWTPWRIHLSTVVLIPLISLHSAQKIWQKPASCPPHRKCYGRGLRFPNKPPKSSAIMAHINRNAAVFKLLRSSYNLIPFLNTYWHTFLLIKKYLWI